MRASADREGRRASDGPIACSDAVQFVELLAGDHGRHQWPVSDGDAGDDPVDHGLVLLRIDCETDFAGRDGNFLGFVETVTNAVFDGKQTDIESLLAAGIETTREALVQKIGENVAVRRAALFEGTVASYVHTNGKIGVLVKLEGGDEALGRDIAMHIAAVNPQVVSGDDVPADVIAKEKEIYVAQAADSGKPPEIVEKMVEGRIRKFLAEISLVEQAFVKDPDIKIGALLKKADAKVVEFARFEVGEGIEVEEVDFAEEVKRQIGGDS